MSSYNAEIPNLAGILRVTDEQQIDFDSVSALVPRAKDGDEEAFNSLLAQLQGYLSMLTRQRLNPDVIAKEGNSDIVQMTLLQAIESFDSFHGNTAGEFNNWIKTILDNNVKQVHRKYGAEKRSLAREQPLGESVAGNLRDAQRTPGTLAAAKEELHAFHQLLDTLPVDYATVIRLRSLDKRSFKEVASLMDRSYDSVTKLWYRAMAALKDSLPETQQQDDCDGH